MAIGVAGLGAIFFGLLGPAAGHALAFIGAAQWTALLTVALLACSFAMARWLPRHARAMAGPATGTEPERAAEPELARSGS